MGGVREGRRRSLMGAGPLLGQLHCLPSVEAKRRERWSDPTWMYLHSTSCVLIMNMRVLRTTHHAWVLRL